MQSLKERLESRIYPVTESGCWLFFGPWRKGYGYLKVAGIYKQAHRIAFEIFKGTIPEKLFVLHKCDTRACCNPNHLELGTNSDNIKDAYKRGRKKPPCIKLSDKAIQEIKISNLSTKEITKLYNISQQHVSRIRRGLRSGNIK